ncbi:MAG: hypothetical protein LBQ24_04910 [Candidatus Peribacteria bacterium]|jgi:hypothetical protein|nr:hypothetical protein [Candidatus Peribacteria bacterium]
MLFKYVSNIKQADIASFLQAVSLTPINLRIFSASKEVYLSSTHFTSTFGKIFFNFSTNILVFASCFLFSPYKSYGHQTTTTFVLYSNMYFFKIFIKFILETISFGITTPSTKTAIPHLLFHKSIDKYIIKY